MAHKDIIELTDPAVNAMDNASHEQTYAGFTRLVKWSIIAMVVLVLVLYFWIKP